MRRNWKHSVGCVAAACQPYVLWWPVPGRGGVGILSAMSGGIHTHPIPSGIPTPWTYPPTPPLYLPPCTPKKERGTRHTHPLLDPRGREGYVLPWGPNSFIFMQFSGKNRLAHPLREFAPLRKILDPPLPPQPPMDRHTLVKALPSRSLNWRLLPPWKCLYSPLLHSRFLTACATARCDKSYVTFVIWFGIKDKLKLHVRAPYRPHAPAGNSSSTTAIRGGSRIPCRRGRQPSRGGANIRFCQIFWKTAWNRENFGPWGGGARRVGPP